MIPKQLAHYKIIEKIGQGGMGTVYRALDTKLDREIALKVLPAEMASNQERLERFKREAKAVAALKHPNIVTVHSVEEDDGAHFLTMELVDGKPLSRIIPKNGLPLDRIFDIAIPLADAVSSAHAGGIIHRDLKPDNIMVDDRGRVRVLDFGLAKLQRAGGVDFNTRETTVAAVTDEGKILGTVAYMSPEQAEGKAVDRRSDVFSLGTILYEMTTGTRPFQGDTSVSTIGSILKDEPASVVELKPVLPRHAGRIIRRCLAKDPERRYQTALDLRNELEELKAEVASGDLDVPLQAAKQHSTRWRSALLLAGAAVVVTAFIMLFGPWTRTARPPTIHTSRPLTSTIGWDRGPNWSPEGEFIAFGRMSSGSSDIYVKPAAGGEAVLRAGGPGDETTPRWSPDGKYLAYLSGSEPGTFVYLVPAYGGTPRKLIETNISALEIQRLYQAMGDRPWSQDSRTLLVARASASGQLAVYRVNRDDRSAEQITFPPPGGHDMRASYSFDGERIVFRREIRARSGLFTMPAAGGEPEALLWDGFDHRKAAWRADNRHVVFESNRGGVQHNLWEIDVVTRSMRQLTFETKKLEGFSISPDDRIVYAPFWHDTFLFTVDVESGERRQLTSHTLDNFGARFSPDGETIAYHSTRTGDCEVWLHPLDGRPETYVTDSPAWDLYPDWSPDGSKIAFVSDRDGGEFKIFVANRDGGAVRLVVDQATSVRLQSPVNRTLIARWSPDGSQLAYLVSGNEGRALWTIEPDGKGARERLSNVTGFDWYGDGRRAVITRRLGSEEQMFAVDLETGRERLLFEGALTEFDVSPDGGSVAFCYGRGHLAMGLAVLKLEPPSDADGLPTSVGEPVYVARSKGTWHVHNGGWSPDSKTIVYTQDTDYGNVYELVEREISAGF